MSETYPLFSVAGGKFHRPVNPIIERKDAFKPTKTACGITVRPLNYFASNEDAESHTGGRLAKWLCKRCGQERAAPADFVFASQDGADFYVSREDNPEPERITAPFKVGDFDMEAAKRARDWFIAKMAEDGLLVEWES